MCSRRSSITAVHLPPAVILFSQVLMGVIVGALDVAGSALLRLLLHSIAFSYALGSIVRSSATKSHPPARRLVR